MKKAIVLYNSEGQPIHIEHDGSGKNVVLKVANPVSLSSKEVEELIRTLEEFNETISE